jgi:hypothetical protein
VKFSENRHVNSRPHGSLTGLFLAFVSMPLAACCSGLPEPGPATVTAAALLLSKPTATAAATAPVTATQQPAATATATAVPIAPPTATASPTPAPTASPTLTVAPTRRPYPTVTSRPMVTAVLESGWIEYQVPAGKFVLALPPLWQSDDPADPSPVVLAPSDPSLIKFVAHEESVGAVLYGHRVALLVTRRHVGVDMPLDVHISRALEALRHVVGSEVALAYESVDLSGVEAGRILFEVQPPGSLGSLVFVDYLIPDVEYLNNLIFQVPDDLASEYVPLFDEIAGAFRWLE